MTHDRQARDRPFAIDRTTTVQHVVHLGSWKVPVIVVALGFSVFLHGGLLATAYLLAWTPARVSNPKINFARGDQAFRTQVLLVPWPDPIEEAKTKLVPQAKSSLTDSSITKSSINQSSVEAVNVEKADIEHDHKEATPQSPVEPSEIALDNRGLLVDKKTQATDVAKLPVFDDVREPPPSDNAIDATPKTQPIEAIVGHLIRQLAKFLTLPKMSEQVDHQPPLVEEAAAVTEVASVTEVATEVEKIEQVATPPTEQAVPSNASSSQVAGVETGVEMLDLKAPKYPSLSRRQGEEGLVLLLVEVLPSGAVGDITVLQDAGFRRLAEAAIDAARQGRFKPATRDGYPVRATVRIPFRFVLR